MVMMTGRSMAESLTKFRYKAILCAVTVFCVISIALILSSIRTLEVRGATMTPGINEGDNILILKRLKSISRGSIIVLHFPSNTPPMVLRRIIALPGDVIEIQKGQVFINDAYIEETYVSDQQNQRQRDLAPIRIPDHTYFVMADNRDGAYDSRDWGVVSDQQIYGKVLIQY
jgi:signal peptidase I